MDLYLPWKKSDTKWLIDGRGSGGNPFHGFVEVNDHTGDAEELACLIVRAIRHYKQACNAAPLWELLDADENVVAYYEQEVSPGSVLDTEKAFTLDGKRPSVGEPAPKIVRARMCYNVPTWWEGKQ